MALVVLDPAIPVLMTDEAMLTQILLDLRMPEVDALGVLEILASGEALRDIPVVVVTTDPPVDAPPALRCLLIVDPLTGRVRAASGGHLPPLLVYEGKAAPVQLAGPLLGVEIERPRDVTFDLPPGGVLVLLTDGLVERSDRSFEVGLAQVLDEAARIGPDLERFCDRLLVELDAARSEDDIALVVLRRR